MSESEIGTVDFDQVKAGLEDKSILYMDVRNKSELENDGKIVGSVNLPLPEIIEAFGKSDSEFQAAYGFSKPEKTINNLVVGCLGGKRAAAAAEQLQQIGFSTIKVYAGSFGDWRAKGGPITKP